MDKVMLETASKAMAETAEQIDVFLTPVGDHVVHAQGERILHIGPNLKERISAATADALLAMGCGEAKRPMGDNSKRLFVDELLGGAPGSRRYACRIDRDNSDGGTSLVAEDQSEAEIERLEDTYCIVRGPKVR